MFRATSVLLSSALVVAACARGAATPPAPAPLDPTGTFSFETTFQGQAITGQIIVRGEAGQYTGSVEPDAVAPPVEIYSVQVEGQQMTVVGDAGGEDLVITMTFTGDTYTGTWVLGFDGGDIKGARVQQD